MPSVWLLQHVRDLGDGHEDVKLVGVFSTEEKARAALAQVSTQPGFRDSLAGFAVNRHVVDEVSWAAGFAGAEGWEPGP